MEPDLGRTADPTARAARIARVRAGQAQLLADEAERCAHSRGRTGPYLAEARRLRVQAVRLLVDARLQERTSALKTQPGGTRAAA
jgi:hypothetical protein